MATRKPRSKLPALKAKVSKTGSTKKAVNKPVHRTAKLTTAEVVGVALALAAKQKIKLVRNSFAMPKNEYITLSDLKLRSARLGKPAKKSEVLRAGVQH